jgi:hypothetical protein
MTVTTDVPAPTDRECIAAELADVLAARLAMAGAGTGAETRRRTDMNTTGIDAVLIRDLRLSTRARNCLRRAEITTAAELVTWTEYELLRDVQGLGPFALAGITDALAERGWALRKQARRVVSWGACPECGRDIGLRADKRLSRHRVTPSGGAWCAGSLQNPAAGDLAA